MKLVKVSILKGWRKAVSYALMLVGVATVTAFGVWWFQPHHIPHNFAGTGHVFDIVLFLFLTYVVWYQIANELLTWELVLFMKKPVHMEPQVGLRVALATAFVPGKEPYDVLEQTLKAMVAVDYQHDTWVLDEGNDATVKKICTRYGACHFSRHGIEPYNTVEGPYRKKTKGGNYNAWFDAHGRQYDIVAQHDVDFVPAKTFLTRTLGYFRDPEVGFVGSPQIYGNTDQSWIASGAAQQAYGFYGLGQRGLFGHDMQLFIGANHVLRTAAHDDIDGYSGHIVEDHLTGMHLYAKRWKSVYVPEILAIGEGPATWSAYFSQQMRWAYGLIDILFRHSPALVRKMRINHAVHYLLLQQYYFFGIAQLIGIVLMTLFYLAGITATTMELRALLIFYPLVIIAQLLNYLWLQQYYIDPKRESGLHLAGKLLSIAAWPVYLVAFIGAVRNKRLTYQVTPKGNVHLAEQTPITLFIPHLILGTITAIDIAAALVRHIYVPQLLFWAILNTLFMYFFFGSVLLNNARTAFANAKKIPAVL